MMLRWLVSEMVRNASRKGLQSVVEQAAHQVSTPGEITEPTEEPCHCEIAIVVGMGVEAGGLIDLLKDARTTRCANYVEHAGVLDGRRVVVAVSGAGAQAANQTTEDLIAIYRPDWVVAAGFAAALQNDIQRGHFLMPQSVVDQAGRVLAVGFQLDTESSTQMKSLHCGQLLSIDELIDSTEEKRRLAEQHGAVACDMETAAVAACCQRCQTRFLSVRIVTDGFDERLPESLVTLNRQKSLSGKLGAAAGAIWNRPGSVKDLWKLKQDALQASDRLGRFLTGVIAQLSG
ncbi:MAG: hypothetical protein VX346_26145 [Planctomycetota bacterium]|nr:hypothetical protein [Planctomycetota bacterium]